MTNLELVQWALKEDLPHGDITTDALGEKRYTGTASLVAKQDLVISGQELFETAVKQMDASASIKWHFGDGDFVLNKQVVANIHGDLIQLLKAERVALNFLGPLSGIATLTKKFVDQCARTNTQILDTRKTRPLYRNLEKNAVKDGGGINHRMNLSDQVLVKENHLFVGEGLENTIEKMKASGQTFIELEVKNLEEVRQAVDLKVDRIMLDNFSNEQITEALNFVPKGIETEASGNMTLDRIASVAALGVTFISVGALTHSAPNADLSLLFHW